MVFIEFLLITDRVTISDKVPFQETWFIQPNPSFLRRSLKDSADRCDNAIWPILLYVVRGIIQRFGFVHFEISLPFFHLFKREAAAIFRPPENVRGYIREHWQFRFNFCEPRPCFPNLSGENPRRSP